MTKPTSTTLSSLMKSRVSASNLTATCAGEWVSAFNAHDPMVRSYHPPVLSMLPPSRQPQPSIDQEIHHDYSRAEDNLKFTGQCLRIQDCCHVPDNKVTRIAGFTPFEPEPIFQRGERADPTAEFHEGAPDDRRQVQPRKTRPFQDQQAAE